MVKNDLLTYEQIKDDINAIEDTLERNNPDEKFELHRRLDSTYQAYIQRWYYSMMGLSKNHKGFSTYELKKYPQCVEDNLRTMQNKLQAALTGMNLKSSVQPLQTIVNNEITVQVNITFEQAKSQIQAMDIPSEEREDILQRLSDIEHAIHSDSSRESKWEKIKPALAWLADKSFDIGKTILPLLLKIQE